MPEAVAATTGLRAAGHRPRNVLGLWVLVAVASGLASALGYAALEGAGPGALAFVLTFTGGAVLTMLAETMMPEAFEDAGRAVGLMTTLGFALAFGLSLAS